MKLRAASDCRGTPTQLANMVLVGHLWAPPARKYCGQSASATAGHSVGRAETAWSHRPFGDRSTSQSITLCFLFGRACHKPR
eukprot:15441667-Alexandrium_andersonii.AAC.1